MPTREGFPGVIGFAEIAVELSQAARREAFGLEAMEVLAARTQDRVVLTSMIEVQRTCALLGLAHRLVKALIPHEELVRQMIVEEYPVRVAPTETPQHV